MSGLTERDCSPELLIQPFKLRQSWSLLETPRHIALVLSWKCDRDLTRSTRKRSTGPLDSGLVRTKTQCCDASAANPVRSHEPVIVARAKSKGLPESSLPTRPPCLAANGRPLSGGSRRLGQTVHRATQATLRRQIHLIIISS
jgi:hypothetical protein